jgi:RimJ/RimL family protein N-acetyltransferase
VTPVQSNSLATARLRLEPVDDHHFDGLRAINGDAEVMRYITGRPETPEDTAAFIARHKANWAALGYAWWVFIEHDSGEIVGTGAVQHLERDPRNPLELGWRLRADRQGKGYATEAALAMARFALERLRASQLLAVCHQENLASSAVMRRIGMRFKGVERWYETDVAVFQMSPGDLVDQTGHTKPQ